MKPGPKHFTLLTPPLLFLLFLVVLPLGITLVYSFLTPQTYGGVLWEFSTSAYRQFFFEQDYDGKLEFTSAYLQIFLRSFILASFTSVLCFILGFPTAYFMTTRSRNQRNFWLFLITIPFLSNLLIRTYAWMLILRDEGLINEGLKWLGWIDHPLPLLYTPWAVGVGLLYSYLPFMVLPIYANLERLDFRFLEASYDLYASKWETLKRVILPLSYPGIVAGCILVFIPSLGSFLAPDLLGGGKHLMIGNLIQLQFSLSRNWPFGSAISMILFVFVIVAFVIYKKTTGASDDRQ